MRQNANTIALFSEFEGDIVKRLRSPGVRWGLFAFRRSGLPMPTGLFLDAAPQPFGVRERRAGESPSVAIPPFRSSAPSRVDARGGGADDVGSGRNQESGVCHRCVELCCAHRKKRGRGRVLCGWRAFTRGVPA